MKLVYSDPVSSNQYHALHNYSHIVLDYKYRWTLKAICQLSKSFLAIGESVWLKYKCLKCV